MGEKQNHSEHKRWDTFQSASEPVMVVNNQFEVLEYNPAAAQLDGGIRMTVGEKCGDVLGCINALLGEKPCGKNTPCADCEIRRAILQVIENREPLRGLETEIIQDRAGVDEGYKLRFSVVPLEDETENRAAVFLESLDHLNKEKSRDHDRGDFSEPFGFSASMDRCFFEAVSVPAAVFQLQQAPENHPSAAYFLLESNPEFLHLTGLDSDALQGKNIKEIFPDLSQKDISRLALGQQSGTKHEVTYYSSRLEKVFRLSSSILSEELLAVIILETTRRVEPDRRQEEFNRQMKQILDSIPADIYVSDLENYRVLFMNEHMKEHFGGDFTGKICWEVFRNLEEPCEHCTNPELLDAQGEPVGVVEWETYNPISEKWYRNLDRAIPWEDGRYVRLQIATDISEQKKTEQALRASEEQFEKAFRGGPLMMAISDLESGVFLEVNDNFVEITGYSREEARGASSLNLGVITEEARQQILADLDHKGRVHNKKIHFQKKNGEQFPIQYFGELISVAGEQRLLSIGEDITEQVRVQKARERSLEELQLINSFMMASRGQESLDAICDLAAESVHAVNPEAIVVVSHFDQAQGGIRMSSIQGVEDNLLVRAANLVNFDLKGGTVAYEPTDDGPDVNTLFTSGGLEEVAGGIFDLAFGKFPRPVCRAVERLLNIGSVYSVGFSRGDKPRGGITLLLPPGEKVHHPRAVESIANHVSVLIDDIQYQEELIQKRQEAETLREVGMLVSQSASRQDATRMILNQLEKVLPYDSATIQLIDDQGIRVVAARGLDQAEDYLGKVYPISEEEIIQTILLEVEAVVVDDVRQLEDWVRFPTGKRARAWLGVPLVAQGKRIGVLTLAHHQVGRYAENDLELVSTFASQAAITLENNRLFEEAQIRMERLSSLRDIDQTIIGSLDVQLTLRVLLDQLLKQLKVDAADVYLYDPLWKTLDFAVARGFWSENHPDTLSLDDELIGQVVIGNRMVRLTDLDEMTRNHRREELFSQEGFVSYYGLPLTAKGEIVGVMEVFQRKSYHPDEEWLGFLRALAGQAAISIDRLNLYLELKQSNMELVQAYDATIASLARALELRDMETEGHCQRVEKQTLRLARACGVPEEELMHIRWGALLHDIGKIGIPDHILHKPGKLTDQEWEIMKKHPEYAFDVLSSIDYLSPSLDIPRYHHERWDGSGYPEGLAGEDIPLAARVFAVVDVWDALRSDRPYRNAWSDEKARKYLREQAGKEFDPQIVEAFLTMI